MRLKGDIGHLDRVPPPRTGLYRYTANGPRVITLAVKVTLQNPSHMLTSRSDFIIRNIVPMGRSVNGGFLPISPRTSPLRHDLQNNKKFKHK